MTSPSISIIVPIYNAAPFLDECLNSIISQSFPDFEVLLVNDGSTDASAEICKKYCANDSRFKYIEIHGRQGSGPARNRGLAGATGRYVVFCDSDDAYSKNALKLLFENGALSRRRPRTGPSLMSDNGFQPTGKAFARECAALKGPLIHGRVYNRHRGTASVCPLLSPRYVSLLKN